MATQGVRYGRKVSYAGKVVYRRKTHYFTLKRISRVLDQLFNNNDKLLSPDATIFYIFQRAARWMDERGLTEQIYGTKGSDFPEYIKQYRDFIQWFDGFSKSSAEIAEQIAGSIPPLKPFAQLVIKADSLYRLVRESFPIE